MVLRDFKRKGRREGSKPGGLVGQERASSGFTVGVASRREPAELSVGDPQHDSQKGAKFLTFFKISNL